MSFIAYILEFKTNKYLINKVDINIFFFCSYQISELEKHLSSLATGPTAAVRCVAVVSCEQKMAAKRPHRQCLLDRKYQLIQIVENGLSRVRIRYSSYSTDIPVGGVSPFLSLLP